MRGRTVAVTAMFVSLLAGSATAQGAGTFEFGGFGRYTRFSADGVALNNKAGFGLRAGVFVSPILSIEVDGSQTNTRQRNLIGAGDVSYMPFHFRALLNMPFSDRLSTFVGAGAVVDRYGKTGHQSDLGVATTAGVRVGLMPMLALRLDATADWIAHRQNGGPRFWNLGAEAGLSVMLGARKVANAAGDDDADGVLNSADRCAGTPAGTAVDPNGCPQRADTDKDGVIDINDTCPNTPAGAKVDANGCSGTEQRPQGLNAAPAPGSEPVRSAASRG